MNMKQKKFLQAVCAASLVMMNGWLGASPPTYADELAPNAAPNLSITKTGTQPGGLGKPGPTVFMLSFQNKGTADANFVTLTETVGAGMVFEPSLSSQGWTCNQEGNIDVCVMDILETMTADPLGAQGLRKVTFAVTPTVDLPPQVDSVSNTVVIADDGKNGADAVPGDNAFTAVAPIGTQTKLVGTHQAVLVTDVNSNGKYDVGDVIGYTFAITNTGTRYANALRLVSDFAPSTNVQIVAGSVSASPSSAVSNTTTSAYALFGNIAPGASVVASFRVSGSIEPPLNLAAITHIGTLQDSYGFNTSTNITTVPIQHSLIAVASTKAGSAAPGAIVKRGEKLSYTIAVTNTGAESIGALKLVDEVNDQGGKAQCFSVVTNTVVTSRGTANTTQNGNIQRVEITVGALANGEVVNVSFDAIVRSTFACSQAFNQASIYNGVVLLADTNIVTNPIEPLKRVLLPLVRRS